MKYLIYLGALIALLRSVAAILSNHHDHQAFHRREQNILGPEEQVRKDMNVTPLPDEVEIALS